MIICLIEGNIWEYNVTIMIKRAYSMTDIIRVISNQRRAQRLKEGEKDVDAKCIIWWSSFLIWWAAIIRMLRQKSASIKTVITCLFYSLAYWSIGFQDKFLRISQQQSKNRGRNWRIGGRKPAWCISGRSLWNSEGTFFTGRDNDNMEKVRRKKK